MAMKTPFPGHDGAPRQISSPARHVPAPDVTEIAENGLDQNDPRGGMITKL